MDLLNALYILREDTKRLAARLAAYHRAEAAGDAPLTAAAASLLAEAVTLLLAGPGTG